MLSFRFAKTSYHLLTPITDGRGGIIEKSEKSLKKYTLEPFGKNVYGLNIYLIFYKNIAVSLLSGLLL